MIRAELIAALEGAPRPWKIRRPNHHGAMRKSPSPYKGRWPFDPIYIEDRYGAPITTIVATCQRDVDNALLIVECVNARGGEGKDG